MTPTRRIVRRNIVEFVIFVACVPGAGLLVWLAGALTLWVGGR